MSAVLNAELQQHWRGQVALVTGASSGIGRAVAALLAAGGCHLVISARRRERLEALRAELVQRHGVRVDVVAADLSVPGAATRLANDVHRLGRHVDVLVNAAGVGLAGRFTTSAWERDQQILGVNIVAGVELTKRLLPAMIERRRGSVVFIGSIAGRVPVPLFASYSASKAFVMHFAEALREEVRGTGVVVTVVSPGATATEFIPLAGFVLPGNAGWLASAGEVAAATLCAAAEGRSVSVPGLLNRVLLGAARLVPRRVAIRVAERIMRAGGAG